MESTLSPLQSSSWSRRRKGGFAWLCLPFEVTTAQTSVLKATISLLINRQSQLSPLTARCTTISPDFETVDTRHACSTYIQPSSMHAEFFLSKPKSRKWPEDTACRQVLSSGSFVHSSDFITNSYGESWDSCCEQITSLTPEPLLNNSCKNSHRNHKNKMIDWSIDLSVLWDACHELLQVHLWGFSCLRESN